MERTWANDDGPMLGGWLTIPGAFAAEVMGSAGFDWYCLDLQHGMITRADLVEMLQGLDIGQNLSIVRVPWNHPPDIMWALDAGAAGVIVPMVNDAEQARAAVRACRFAPAGTRSWGPTRVALHTRPGTPAELDASVRCIIMIETAEAVERLDDILAVPGIDGVFVGPSDLAVSLGLDPRDGGDAAHAAAIERILERCLAHAVLPGIFCGTAQAAIRYRDLGYRLLALCSDIRLVRDAASRALASVRDG
jgi:4-hydroxy-2-oxoheptanedioate aldolase